MRMISSSNVFDRSSLKLWSLNRMPCLTGLIVFLSFSDALTTSTFAQNANANGLREVQREYSDVIRPLLETHCGDCHWGDDSDADLNLEQYRALDQLLSGRKKWKKVLTRVAAREMPPEDYDPIEDEDHAKLLAWIDQLLNSVDCTNINPGNVTIRRLNRTEYQNTIKDLTGVNFQADRTFPADDVGYGFDNIADVLSLSPILMEKYLKAAETITLQAVRNPERDRTRVRLTGKDFSTSRGSAVRTSKIHFFSNATATHKLNVKKKGTYRFVVRTGGEQAGSEPCKLRVDIDGRQRKTYKITAEIDEPQDVEYKARFSKPGEYELNLAFTNDFYQPKGRDAEEQDRNLYVYSASIEGPMEKSNDRFGKLVLGDPGESKKQQSKVARKSISVFASRAYRRPATKEEVGRLMGLFNAGIESGDAFEKALRFAFQAVLVSPHFLFKIEKPVAAGEIRDLDDFELATSLSYFLWSSMPDSELLRLASKGELKNKDVFREQVVRMLKDQRAKAVVQNFASQWLQLRSLARMQPDAELYPGVDAQLRKDMETETKLLVYDLIRKDARVTELLNADYTFMNQRLAEHYGVSGISGDRFERVSYDRSDRKGILSHASILTLTSNPNRTSPVKRGKWIMENMLGEEPPPPDPDAMQLEDQAELTGTLRQRMEQHRANPACAVCHKVMDQLGFALENYDAVGKRRINDEFGPIDSRGELPDGTVFEGSDELQSVIATGMRTQFVRCLAEKMLIYALGRGLEYYDECTLDKITQELRAGDYKFSALIVAVCESDPFRKRFGEGASPGQN